MDFDHSLDTISADVTTDPIRIGGTAGIKMPSGTTAERVNETGILRNNTTNTRVEYYDGSNWKWIANNSDLEILRRRTSEVLYIDMLGANYTLSSTQAQYAYIVLTNVGDGTKKLIIPNSEENPSEYNIFIYDSFPVIFENSSADFSLTIPPFKNVQILYAYASPTSGLASIGNFATQPDFDDIVTNVRSVLTIDMAGANYTCTAAESLYSSFVLLNVGDGTKVFKIQDTASNPCEYNFYIYDSAEVYIENVAASFSYKITPLKVEKMVYSYNNGSPVTSHADYAIAVEQTPATGTKISVNAEGIVTTVENATTADINDSYDRRYLTESEKGIVSGSLGGALFIQQTDPNIPSAYIWFKTDAYGNVIDILKGGT